MVRGIEKRRIVNDVVDRKNFVKRLGELSAGTNTSIYAWALMTNHEHILLRSSEIGLSGFMRRFLTGYAISYNRRHRRWGHLFLSEALAPLAGGKTAYNQIMQKGKCVKKGTRVGQPSQGGLWCSVFDCSGVGEKSRGLIG